LQANRSIQSIKPAIHPAKLQGIALTAPGWHRYVIGLGLAVAWSAVLLGLPGLLPLQAASWLTFVAVAITPGYLLGDLIVRTMRLDWIERLAIAFPLGMAVLSAPGLYALLRHDTATSLALGWIAASGAVIVAWVAGLLWEMRRPGRSAPADRWELPELLLLAFVTILFLFGLPSLNLYKIDGDAYAVGSFAADALAGLPLNSVEPLFGTDLGPGVRMAFNQSLPFSYLWAYLSGIDPLTLTAQASRAAIALWSLLALYALGKAAGSTVLDEARARRLGLAVVAIQMLIYLANPFLRGDSVSWFFFERTTADKFMTPIVMLPVAFAFAIRFLAAHSFRAWLVAAIAALAVSAIHPLIAAMMALALAAFAAFHAALNWRDRVAWLHSSMVGALVVLAMILPIVQLVLSHGEEPLAASFPHSVEGWLVGEKLVPALPFVHAPTLNVYGPPPDLSQVDANEVYTEADPFLIWRFSVNMNRRRLILPSLDRYFSDPNIILEPAYILALLLLPLLLKGIRRNIGAQFAMSTTLAILFVMFNPLVTPLIGALVMPWILWRFVWMLPYALIIGLAADRIMPVAARALAGLWSKLPAERALWEQRLTPYGLLATLLAATLILAPGTVHNLAALKERAGFPYYYPTPERLLSSLDELTTANGAATVLADQDLSVSIPAYAAHANIVAHRIPTTSEIFPADRQHEALQRLIDQDLFFRSRYLTEEAVAVLLRYNAGYIITHSASNLDIQLRLAPEWFEWLIDDQSYSLYAVRKLPQVTASVQGNTALAERRWDAAADYYRQALAENPGNLLALAGLAEIAHARGQFTEAIGYYEDVFARVNLPVVHYRLGQIYHELGQVERSIEEFSRAQEIAPQIARFHMALGDVCLSAGREECAAEQYAAAVANQNLPDVAAQAVAQADLWRQRGRTDVAIRFYEQAVELQASEANQLMLASAYQEQGRYEEAEALLRVMRVQRPLSVEVLTLSAGMQATRGRYDEAVAYYKRAIAIQDVTGQESAGTRLLLAQTMAAYDHLAEAEALIGRVLELQPDNALAYGQLGDVYNKLGRPAEAMEAYQQAFRLDPTQVQLYLALSNQFRQQGGRQDDILELLQTAIRANPEEATLALALGDQLQRRGDTEAAIDAYQTALDKFELYTAPNTLNPGAANTSRAFAYIRLASVAEDMGLLEPAMNYYSAAVAAAPDVAWTHVTYGDALRRRNDVENAAAAYQRGIDVDPQFANAYVRLADLRDAQGSSASAAALRQQALGIALASADFSTQSKTHPGLGKATDGTSAALQSFDSDAPTAARTGTASTGVLDQRIVAQLVSASEPAFPVNEGPAHLNLLARLSEGQGLDDIILLYQKAIETGTQQGWYPVDMARYYKGAGDLYLQQKQPILAAEAYRYAILLDDWWPQARLGLAHALAAIGATDEALEQLEQAVRIAPGFVEAQTALADAYRERGRHEEALAIYQATADNHPGNAHATLALARALQANYERAAAEETYRQTLALNAGNSEAYVELAALLSHKGRNDEAADLLSMALAADRRNVNAYIQWGVLEQRLGNTDMAQDWFRRARALQPDNDSVTLALTDLLQRFGQYDIAFTYAQEALKADPQNVEFLVRLARLQRERGLHSEAMNTLLGAARMNLTDARLSAELGELYLAQGRPQAALSAFRQAVALNPSESHYYLRLAGLWSNQGNLQAMEDLLRSGLAKANQRAPLYVALADSYLQQARPGDAKDVLSAGLAELGGDTALAASMGLYLESQAQQKGGAQEDAEKWYNDHLALRPTDAAIHRALADHYLRVERVDEALAHYEQAVELEPTNANYRLAAGAGYAAAGRAEDAEQAYRQAILLEPTMVDGYLALAGYYGEQQRWEDAEAQYEHGRAAAPASGRVLTAYAEFWAKRGDRERALALLEEAGQISPSAETLVARAGVYRLLRDHEAALADLTTALKKEPGLLDAMLALGDLHRELGNTRSAQQTFSAATELRPGVPAGRVRVTRTGR